MPGLGAWMLLKSKLSLYNLLSIWYPILLAKNMNSWFSFFFFLVLGACGESCTSFTQWNSALHPVSVLCMNPSSVCSCWVSANVHCILLCLLFTFIAFASYPSIKTKNAFCLRIFKHPLPCSPLPPPLLTTTPISPHSAPTGEWGCISTCVCCGLCALACLSVCMCVCVFVCLFVFVGHF